MLGSELARVAYKQLAMKAAGFTDHVIVVLILLRCILVDGGKLLAEAAMPSSS